MFSPKFTITNQLLKNISDLEAARGVIDNAVLVPAWERKFEKEAIEKTVFHGAHLEGNDLSFDQAKKIIEHIDGRKSLATISQQAGLEADKKDVQEIINYRNVLRHLALLQEKHQRVGGRFLYYKESELKAIHQLALEEIFAEEGLGKYRDTRLVLRDSSGEVSFKPPPPVEVPYQIEHFFEWLNSLTGREVHPVIRAGITHCELIRIYPFAEGSGPTARAFAALVLFREGYAVNRFFSLEEYFDKDAASYYQALRGVSKKGGDLTGWLEYFTLGLAVEFEKIKKKVKKLDSDTVLKERGQQIALSDRQIKIIEFLRKNTEITVREGRKVLPGLSDDTILREIKDLMKKKVVVKRGSTKAARYVLKEI